MRLECLSGLTHHSQIFSWRYRVDALEHNCNPSINCRSRDGNRAHGQCANTGATTSASGFVFRDTRTGAPTARCSGSSRGLTDMERWPDGSERIH
jgi:hypothetical protein